MCYTFLYRTTEAGNVYEIMKGKKTLNYILINASVVTMLSRMLLDLTTTWPGRRIRGDGVSHNFHEMPKMLKKFRTAFLARNVANILQWFDHPSCFPFSLLHKPKYWQQPGQQNFDQTVFTTFCFCFLIIEILPIFHSVLWSPNNKTSSVMNIMDINFNSLFWLAINS